MKTTRPGYCEVPYYVDIKAFKKVVVFIKPKGKCVDIGVKNAQADYIKSYFGISIEQLIVNDLNFDNITGKYDTIFCFHTIEHLQNPLHCMRELKTALNKNGRIYLIIPCRPRFIWKKEHYFEIPPKHFIKWIAEPLGLTVTRFKNINPPHSMFFYFTSFNNFFRILFNRTVIYEIIKIEDNPNYKCQ